MWRRVKWSFVGRERFTKKKVERRANCESQKPGSLLFHYPTVTSLRKLSRPRQTLQNPRWVFIVTIVGYSGSSTPLPTHKNPRISSAHHWSFPKSPQSLTLLLLWTNRRSTISCSSKKTALSFTTLCCPNFWRFYLFSVSLVKKVGPNLWFSRSKFVLFFRRTLSV